MNTSKILLSAAAFALLIASPAFATSATDTTTAPAVDTAAPAPEMAPAPEAAPAPETPAAEPAPAAAPETIDSTTPPATDAAAPPADTTAAPAEEAAPAPAEEAPKPKPKKKAPPAKLSALAKKYDLMSLDTDGNKSLSKSEFTANGFASDKTFAQFDADHNGKLTNAEINAYAARIEANSKK